MMILQVLDNRRWCSPGSSAPRQLAIQWAGSKDDSKRQEGCLTIDLNCNKELQATLLEALGEAYLEYGAYSQAVSAYTDCLKLRTVIFGERNLIVAQSRRRLACALRYEGNWRDAYEEIELAIASIKDTLGENNVVYGDAVLERSVIHLMAHRLAEARKDARDSRTLFDAKQDIRRLYSMDVEARVIEVCAAESAGTLEPARDIYREILESKEMTEEHPWRPTFVHNEGTILHALGDYVGAKDNFTEAIMAWDCGSEPRPEQIDAYINRGRANRALKDFRAARSDVEMALRLDTKLRGPRHPYVAYDLVGLARLLIEEGAEGNVTIALKALDDAIAIYRENKFETHAYLEAALRRRFELTGDEANRREADRIRDALKNACAPNSNSCP